MSKVIVSQEGFEGGEISTRLDTRHDLDFYNKSCKKLENVVIRNNGAVIKRPGLKYITSIGTAPPPAPTTPYVQEDCGRIGSLVDYWEFDTVFAYQQDLNHVEDTVYSLVFQGGTPAAASLELLTFACDNDGAFGAELDRQDLPIPGGPILCMIRINAEGSTTNKFAIFYGSGYLYQYFQVQVVSIDSDGIITWGDYHDFGSTGIGTLMVRSVVRMSGTFYAVVGTIRMAIVDISEAGIIDTTLKDSISLYGAFGTVDNYGIARIGTSNYLVASKWRDTWQEQLGLFRVEPGTGATTLEDTLEVTAEDAGDDYNSILKIKSCNESGFNGFLFATRNVDTPNGIQIETISISGGSFGSVVDSIIVSGDYACDTIVQIAHLGGQGYMINFLAVIGGNERNCAATFLVKADGTLEVQTDVTVVHLDPWTTMYNPEPIQLDGNSDIWMFSMTHRNDQDGFVFTTDIYGGTYCTQIGSCYERYN